ncbi:MAG TPA: hypothetical protein VK476_03935 [Flavobacterium sp.]|nr:hypothetical protein [Flavobacterium sp.]
MGYSLAQFEPQTAEKLAAINSTEPILMGLKSGKETYQREQKAHAKRNEREWVEPVPIKDKFNERSTGRQDHSDQEHDR